MGPVESGFPVEKAFGQSKTEPKPDGAGVGTRPYTGLVRSSMSRIPPSRVCFRRQLL
jgi:hypothetical protein